MESHSEILASTIQYKSLNRLQRQKLVLFAKDFIFNKVAIQKRNCKDEAHNILQNPCGKSSVAKYVFTRLQGSSPALFGISATIPLQGCNFTKTLVHHKRHRFFAHNILFETEPSQKSPLHCRLATLLKNKFQIKIDVGIF